MDTTAGKLVLEAQPAELTRARARSFDDLYTEHFAFVWRNLRRMGVAPALVEDAAQDTFIVLHRRLADMHEGASEKGFLFGIALRVAHDYRRSQKRKPTVSYDLDTTACGSRGPFDSAAQVQAARTLERFLSTLDDDKRAVFTLAELEEMSAPEISETLGVGVNTIYSRLRVARERFVAFLAQEKEAGGSHG